MVDNYSLSVTYYDSPILQNTTSQSFVLTKLSVVDSNVFFLCGGLKYTRVAIFNIITQSWELTDFTLSNQGKNR
jgi:hypothetical protein